MIRKTSAGYSFLIFLISAIVFGAFRVCDAGGLKKNFYKQSSCPQAEDLVRSLTRVKAQANPALGAKLIRLQFHDCFVRGCDASILLDRVGSDQAEKEARASLSLSGYDEINDIKSKIEQVCPGVVSCSDILALAARDAVSFPFRTPLWDVLTGRRDGNVSLASEVNGNIPSAFSNFTTLKQLFMKKRLNANDLVALSGAHTIGLAHCGTFARRLYNFTGKGDADPSLDATYIESLKLQCPNPANPQTTVEMDPQSSGSFDTSYFDILVRNKGLFQSDAALLTDRASRKTVEQLRETRAFLDEFGKSMKKMAAIGVLTGNAGEIRKQCGKINS